MDAIDRRLVDILQRDGRIAVSELATRAGIARATAYTRLERLQRDGVIRGYGAVVDPEKVGLALTALVLAKIEQGDWREVRDELLRLPWLSYLAVTSGEYDFVLVVRVPDLGTLRDVVLVGLHGMSAIRSTETVFVLDEHIEPFYVGPISMR